MRIPPIDKKAADSNKNDVQEKRIINFKKLSIRHRFRSRAFWQQAQQLQTEIRALNQTLSVKQGDITQLNKDNGRLAAELGATQKTVAKLEAEQRKLTTNLESKPEEVELLKTQLSEFENQSEELDKLKRLNEELLAWKAQASVSIGKLETEISIKTEMMNRLLEERSKTPEASG